MCCRAGSCLHNAGISDHAASHLPPMASCRCYYEGGNGGTTPNEWSAVKEPILLTIWLEKNHGCNLWAFPLTPEFALQLHYNQKHELPKTDPVIREWASYFCLQSSRGDPPAQTAPFIFHSWPASWLGGVQNIRSSSLLDSITMTKVRYQSAADEFHRIQRFFFLFFFLVLVRLLCDLWWEIGLLRCCHWNSQTSLGNESDLQLLLHNRPLCKRWKVTEQIQEFSS